MNHSPIMKRPRRSLPLCLAIALGCAALSCFGTHKVKVEPVEVKPIHMTIDINVKVDRELDEFFDFEDELSGDEARPGETGETTTDETGETGETAAEQKGEAK